MNTIVYYGDTDPGKVRTNNEDSFIVRKIWDEDHILAIVIDGVGGYAGGEVAAALARKRIVDYLENYPDGERLELLKQAVISANNMIFSERNESEDLGSMCCVLTAVLLELKNRRINMAHVGDTRLYQFADGMLSKLSHDHSLVGYREEIGELTEEEAMKHPQRNVIGRAIGSKLLENGGKDYVESASFPLLSKSSLLLCSDGLSDMLTSARISAILASGKNVQERVKRLIDCANEEGGKDNVTVALVEVDLEECPMPKVIDHENGTKNTGDSECDTIRESFGWRAMKMAGACALMLFFFLAGRLCGRWDTRDGNLEEIGEEACADVILGVVEDSVTIEDNLQVLRDSIIFLNHKIQGYENKIDTILSLFRPRDVPADCSKNKVASGESLSPADPLLCP